jgi:hypothetical protein
MPKRPEKGRCIFEYGYIAQSDVRTVRGKQKRFLKKETPIRENLFVCDIDAGFVL